MAPTKKTRNARKRKKPTLDEEIDGILADEARRLDEAAALVEDKSKRRRVQKRDLRDPVGRR